MPSGFNAPPVSALNDVLDRLPRRARTSSEYWQRLHPHMRGFGITRLADITGLDRVGLPVVQAVRPLARSNAVTQGKASDLAGAAVGAVLECLEMAAGEDPARLPPAPCGTPEHWADLAPGLPEGTRWPDADTGYIWAWDLVRRVAVAMPRDLISTDFTTTAPAGDAPILRQSIGLGAGQSLDAALMHGLLECIEGDARLRADMRDTNLHASARDTNLRAEARDTNLRAEARDAHLRASARGGPRRLALNASDPTYGPALARARDAGLRVTVDHLPCAAPVRVVMASVMDQPGATALPLPAVGYGARFATSAAIAAAISEALQARLAVISGAREDITQRFYRIQLPAADLDRAWRDHAEHSADPPPPDAAPLAVGALASHVGPVYGVPLHWDADLPLAITRIIAPNLIADPLRLQLGAGPT